MKKIIIAVSFVVLFLLGLIMYLPNINNDIDIPSTLDVKQVSSMIVVQIKGEVNNPGIYNIRKGARVEDLIILAGGVTNKANIEEINLVKILSDSDVIVVKAKDASSTPDLININSATLEELTTLPNIGQSKAEAIIAYREQYGMFNRIEDLLKVSGISQSIFNKIYAYISVK